MYNNKISLINIIITCILVLILSIQIWAIFESEILTLGTLGDFIGGTIGTIAAIIAVYFSYTLNKKQFEQFDEQAKQIKEQSDQFERQSFENGFFNLLNIYIQRVGNLEYEQKKGEKVYDLILNHIQSATDPFLNNPNTLLQFEMFNKVVKQFETEFSVLILNYKAIINFIDSSELKQEQKDKYVHIYHASISISQMSILNRYRKIVNDDVFNKFYDTYPNHTVKKLRNN